jgi:hypothetical protein
VELLPNLKSSLAFSKVATRVLFLSRVATLGFPEGRTGGGDDGATGIEQPLTPEVPRVLVRGGGIIGGGGVTTGCERTSGRL